MDYVALAWGLALPWLAGFSLLAALDWPRAEPGTSGGVGALRFGYAYLIGVLLLTLLMRALSAGGVRFSWTSIGFPLLGATAALFAAAWRGRLRQVAARATLLALVRPRLPRLHAWVWLALLGWLGLRLALLAAEVAWQPLYPWDAWTQVATKARTWYELGRIVPFVPAGAWLAGTPGAYFDAAPGLPATVPLLQVWSAIALGRWDDSATNWPWLLALVALALTVYGALRDAGLPSLGALAGAYLAASLPLLDTHVALAGCPDLLLALAYTLAALAFERWTRSRAWHDAAVSLASALACPLIQSAGVVWALTLLPGVAVAVLDRRGMKLVAAALGLAGLGLLALARWPSILGYPLHLVFAPSWRSLVDGYLLLANWHLLWYLAIALGLLGARRLVRAPLAPLAAVAASGLAFVLFVLGYADVAARAFGAASVNRAALPLAPLLACLGALLWRDMTARPRSSVALAAAPLAADA